MMFAVEGVPRRMEIVKIIMYVLKLESNYYSQQLDKLETSMPLGVDFFAIKH